MKHFSKHSSTAIRVTALVVPTVLLVVVLIIKSSLFSNTTSLRGIVCPSTGCVFACNTSNCIAPAVCLGSPAICTFLGPCPDVTIPTCGNASTCRPDGSTSCLSPGATTACCVGPMPSTEKPPCCGTCLSGTCVSACTPPMCNPGVTVCVGTTCVPIGSCGDNATVAPEECDDGNTVSGDGCSNICKTESCGDGYRDANGQDNAPGGGDDEACDDGNNTNGDGCTAACNIQNGWSCENLPLATSTSVCTVACGDGIVTAPEVCDNGKHCPNGPPDLGKQCSVAADCPGTGACAVVQDGCSANCMQKRCTVALGYPGYPPQVPPPTTPLPPGNTPPITIDCAILGPYMNSFKTLCENTCGGPGTCIGVNETPAKYIKCDGPDAGIIAGDHGVLEAYYYCPHHFGNCPLHPPPGPPPFPWLCKAPSPLLPLCTAVALPPPLVVAPIAPLVARILTALDVDRSGVLSNSEMYRGITMMFQDMKIKNLRNDLNNDGAVDRKDLILLLTTLRGLHAAVCGNGTIDTGEQCDDKNTKSGDGCSKLCRAE